MGQIDRELMGWDGFRCGRLTVMGRNGTESSRMGWDGMGWDGMKRNGIGWDEAGWDGTTIWGGLE